jgi:membrane protein implicated in regulation of membrane protease activity
LNCPNCKARLITEGSLANLAGIGTLLLMSGAPLFFTLGFARYGVWAFLLAFIGFFVLAFLIAVVMYNMFEDRDETHTS